MLVGLAVLWFLFDTLRQPANWNWLSANEDSVAAVAAGAGGAQAPFVETVVPGPNDLDPEVFADFQSREELITDRSALRPREMIAYWQLLGWSRTQAFPDFEKRARQEPALTQIWEEPKKYRGQPIRLRMHVRRVLEFEVDAAKNPLGASKVYEAMGWTDESKSLPYTVVFIEKPPELPIGNAIEAEVVFVGYFLKIMTYTAFDDTRRGTPLLMGRIRVAKALAPKPPVAAKPLEIAGLVLGGVLLTGLCVWFLPRGKRPPRGTVFSTSTIDAQWIPWSEAAAPPAPTDFAKALANSSTDASDEGLENPASGPVTGL